MYFEKTFASRLVVAGLLVVIGCVLLNNPKQMSPVWTAPFLSAAANWEPGNGFQINEKEALYFKSLSATERENYQFTHTQPLAYYNHNPIGYVYFIWIAKHIFFGLGDLQAIEWLQISIHVILSLLIVSLARGWIEYTLYLLLYALNPLVIYFVTFPFYYCLQAIPSVLLLCYLHPCARPFRYGLVPLAVCLALVVLTRPTVLLVVVLFFIYVFRQEKRRYAWLSLGIFLFCLGSLYVPSRKNFWHTAYIGIGGYPNSYMKGLTDENGYAIFEKNTGITFEFSPGGNYYQDSIADSYAAITRAEYLKILKEKPLLVSKNVILNIFESFSAGYFVDYPLWVTYLSAAIGLLVCVWLLYQKAYLWVGAIMCSSITFTAYFPPIQSYMFGSYALLVGAMVQSILPYVSRVLRQRKSSQAFKKVCS